MFNIIKEIKEAISIYESTEKNGQDKNELIDTIKQLLDQVKNDKTYILLDYIKRAYHDLDDLAKRIQDDVSGDNPFKSYDGDQLLLVNILDLFDELKIKRNSHIKKGGKKI